MIILPSTTDKLSLITSNATGDLDVVASYGEVDQATPPVVKPFGRQLTNITTNTTTDILAAPAASTTRTPEEITVRNAHASNSNDVTVQYNANGTLYEMIKVTLSPGDTLEYIRGIGWFTVRNNSAPSGNQSTADQATAAGTDTYLTGSSITIPTSRPLAIGTKFLWKIVATKTAAGAAAWSMIIRFGTAGTVSDTARLTFTQVTNVQTAAVDTGVWDIVAVVRGPIGASCIVAGGLNFTHHLAATGFSTVGTGDCYQITSAAFDCTTAGMIVGLSCNPGASGVFTFQVVQTDVRNL